MGKDSALNLDEWVSEGWTFRVKTVKGRKYITRRKNQAEKSLGPYNDELWKSIKDIQGHEVEDTSNKLFSEQMKGLSLFTDESKDMALQFERGRIKLYTCVFRDADYDCLFWEYGQPVLGDFSTMMFTKKKDVKGNIRWVHPASIFFCQKCTAYLSRKHIDAIRQTEA